MHQNLNRNIPLIFAFEFFHILRFYDAVAIILFAAIVGNYTLGMAVFSVLAVTTVLAEVPTGVLSDRIGRKYTIVAGAVCSLASVSLFALAQNFALLALGGFFLGIANAFYSGNNQAILFETLKATGRLEQHHKILGRMHSFGYLARALSALVCAVLLFIAPQQTRLLLTLSIFPQALTLILSFFMIEPKIAPQTSVSIAAHLAQAWQLLKSNRKARLLAAAFVDDCSFGYVSYEMMTAFLNSIIPTWLIGAFDMVLCLLGAIGSFVSTAILKMVGFGSSLVGGTLIVGLLRLLSALIGTLVAPILFALGQLFYSITDVSQQHLLQMEYSDKERATIGSLVSFLSGVAWGVASLLIGILADLTSPQIALATTIVLWTLRACLFKKSLR